MLSKEEVIWGYRYLLDREPESEEIVGLQQGYHNSVQEFRHSLINSQEFKLKTLFLRQGSDYLGYRWEDLRVFDEFDLAVPQTTPGFVTDFHGSRARISSLWDGLQHLDGVVLPKPIPGDYHADTTEWLGVLKAVLASRDCFVAMELGAGIGPWLIASAVAARVRGIETICLLGVEADPGRFALMIQNFHDNMIDPNEHTLICGAVGTVSGKAKWPRIVDPRNFTGGRPIRKHSGQQESLDSGDLKYLEGLLDGFVDVHIVPFEQLLETQERWDLVHLDVQGTEVELCTTCLSKMSKCVRYLVVGTHSRKLDGDLLALMYQAGWDLEHEKPVGFSYNKELQTLERMTSTDGVQVWRNPKL
jgi:FkbM family methyltransferase